MRLAWLAAALTLASCAMFTPGEAPTGPPAAFAPSSLEELAGYLARLNAMNDAAIAAEGRRQRPGGQRPADDVARVKAAMALLLSGEDAEAAALLDPVTRRSSGDAGLKAMASFLHAMATDRRRLRESASAANARLREERRAHDALRTRAEAASERAAQLQQKLDALTELEKSLSDRPLSSR